MPDGINEASSLVRPGGRGEAGSGAAPAPFVVVLGMHRSGTSLCSDVLGRLGVAMAETPDAQPSNPKGQWERPEIVAWHDRVLASFDRRYFTPLHDLPLPAGWWLDPAVTQIRREMIGFLELKLKAGTPFGFKDPRTARLLPLWHQIFDELRVTPRIVLCVRNPAQVARSLEQRDGLPADLGEYRWFAYMAEIFRHLRNFRTCVIEYEAWFDEVGDNTDKLGRFLGMPVRAEATLAVAEIVDRQLRHDDLRRRDPEHFLVRSLYELVRRFDESATARTELADMLDRLAAFEQLQQAMHLEFEPLAQIGRALLGAKLEQGAGSVVSWRDPAVAAEWSNLLAAASRAETMRARLQNVLQQRAKLDVELARAQQQAALHERAAARAAAEIAELRRQLEEQDAAPTEAGPGAKAGNAP